jgi:hypothetical protein
MSKQEYFEANNDLAFNVTVDALGKYATKCKKDKKRNIMDPILGSYLLTHQLACALLYKAEGYEKQLVDIMQEAIEDAKEVVKNSRSVQ